LIKHKNRCCNRWNKQIVLRSSYCSWIRCKAIEILQQKKQIILIQNSRLTTKQVRSCLTDF
jgi:hypothetical protein